MYAKKETAIKNLKKGVSFSNDNFNKYRDNEEIAIEAVNIDGANLFWASERIRGVKDIALQAVTDSPEILWCVSDELKDDKELILRAVSIEGSTLNNASDRLKNDPEVVLTAIKNNISSFFYASEELQCAYDNSQCKNLIVLLETIMKLENVGLHYEAGMDVCVLWDRVQLQKELQNSLSKETKNTSQKHKI